MNEIRQLCTISSSPDQHFDEILALFHACPPQHLLPSLSLICQSISCMAIEQFHWNLISHPIFELIQQWSEQLFEIWLKNRTLNGEEYRAIFYIHQLYKFLSEWLNEQNEDFVNKKIFLHEDFLQTLAKVIDQLIEYEIEEISDDELSTEDIHLQTETSDIQAKQTDVFDVLYRCINSLIILYTHRNLIHHHLVEENLNHSIFNCLKQTLFIQLSKRFCQENLTNEKISIRSRFFLFTCLDYCLLTDEIDSKISLISSIKQIWNEIPEDSNNESSLLIVRFIRLINQIALVNQEILIKEDICSIFLKDFSKLCQMTDIIDDFNTFILTFCSTKQGREYLRQLDFLQYLLSEIKFHPQFWYPIGSLLTSNDFKEIEFLKNLIQNLEQKTMNILQSLTIDYDSTKSEIIDSALEWFNLLRQAFLSYANLTIEFLHSIKKFHFISIYTKIILSFEHKKQIIDTMLDLLLTLTLNSPLIISKNSEFYQWLKTDRRLTSQLILSVLDLASKPSAKLSPTMRSSNTLICFITTDKSCLPFRDHDQYIIEYLLTSNCRSFNSLIDLLNRSFLCIFCADIQMKFDNLAHFIYLYLINQQTTNIPLLTIFLQDQIEYQGTWLENLFPTTFETLDRDIRENFNRFSSNFLQRSVDSWSMNDVIQWCETREGYFPSLHPLVRRLNGRALLHLAEILSIEPASMYHSLNAELIQRTGTNVPLTEYVSLRSELQKLTSNENISKKKKFKHSRFCTLF